MSQPLQALLSPRSIALVGASADLDKLGGRPLKFLLDRGYKGRIYPINPKYADIAGLPCYPSVAALPEAVDLAIVAVPARDVEATLDQLGQKGVPAAVVFSSGFAEMGEAGRAMEARMVAVARRYGIRVVGPNTLGLLNAFDGVMATFSQYPSGPVEPGPVAFATQSGAFGTAIAALCRRRQLNLGYFVNTGNEADLSFPEVMTAMLADARIRVGCGYMEGLKNGVDLVAMAEAALVQGKPIVTVKVGRTAAGARAAASHTGALAGEDRVFDGVARQTGLVRATNEEQMLDFVEAFAYCPLPVGGGIGVITQSGGAGVLIADRAEELGLTIPTLTEATQAKLRHVVPAFGSIANPVDVTAQFLAQPSILRDSIDAVMADSRVHIGIVWMQLMDAHVDMLVELFAEAKERTAKPLIICWVAASDQALAGLRQRGVCVMRGADPAVDAAHAMVRYGATRRRFLVDRATAAPAAPTVTVPVDLVPGGGVVPTVPAQDLLRAAGVKLASVEMAETPEEAGRIALRLGRPVALKIESPDIPHKTEVGGVRLGLSGEAAARDAARTLLADVAVRKPTARIDGIAVQPMAKAGVELVVGLRRDPAFGMVVMLGLGGIFVEVLKDVAFRKAPVAPAEARAMIEELKGKAVLRGVRGKPAADEADLVELVCAVSRFGAGAGPRLVELDLNPVIAGPDGAEAVDWLMVVGPA
jgi:acetyltransferase